MTSRQAQELGALLDHFALKHGSDDARDKVLAWVDQELIPRERPLAPVPSDPVDVYRFEKAKRGSLVPSTPHP